MEVGKLRSFVNIISSDLGDLRGVIKYDKGNLEEDNVIFECADSMSSGFLITSDRRFTDFRLSDFLEIVDSRFFVSRLIKT